MSTEWYTHTADTETGTFALRKCRGVLHLPDDGRAHTVLIATHFSHDFSDHYIAGPLADRGYAFFGWNNRFTGADEFFRPDQALVDVGAAVSMMRDRFDNVVLLGNSGGGSLMSAYQSEAVGPSFLDPIGDIYGAVDPALPSLEPADGYVALNAHESRPKILTEWFDPSVTDERDPLSADPSLDLWGPEVGDPPYDPEFATRYRAAQVDRNDRITAWVRGQLEEMHRHGGSDRVFSVYRTWADPRCLDMSIEPSDREPGCYLGADMRKANYSAYGLARVVTLKTWLSMWALDVDVLNTKLHLPRVTVPSLVIQGTADKGVYPSNAEALHENLGAEDKTLVWIQGGDHYFASDPDHVDQVADEISSWLAAHDFPPAD